MIHKEETEGVTGRDKRSHWERQKEPQRRGKMSHKEETEGVTKKRQKEPQRRDRRSH